MRVLVACEFSGVVRRAFIERGHTVWSCDLLPTELPLEYGGENHWQGDVIEFIKNAPYDHHIEFDLMIAHPPCTYLANSGVKHLYKKGQKKNGKDKQRWSNMREAAEFFKALLSTNIPHIAIENPIMHGYGQDLIGVKPSQIIQPWQFGHGEIKATCLWLGNLPPLKPTRIVNGRKPRVHHASPGPDRWKERSRTLQGIADAMAEQWGGLENVRAA